MTPQNLDLARAGIDAWNRGDMDAVLASRHPEFEWHTSGVFPGLDAVYRGVEGSRKFDRDFRAIWESLTFVVDELHDGDDRVAALGAFEARGRDGMYTRRPVASVTTFRDGLVVRIDSYMDWNEALAALRQATE
jgi:ketosteroid isomerase-like protein